MSQQMGEHCYQEGCSLARARLRLAGDIPARKGDRQRARLNGRAPLESRFGDAAGD